MALLLDEARQEALDDTREAAEAVGLRYVSDDEPGFTRRKAGRGFTYYDTAGKIIRDASSLKRLRSLAVPPAYHDVWICRDAAGHIQATGRDEKGRKQYRYHAKWHEARDSAKYEHMLTFAKAPPAIREQIAAHMRLRNLSREKVLATVVHLLETTLIRVGNEDYARTNKSYGLTTLRDRHVEIDGGELKFEFKGKSGKSWKLQIRDKRIARVVKQCQDLPGQHLFQYVDDEGAQQAVTSSDVNAYLREISGTQITAKDFRTWAGTVLAAMALSEFEAVDSAARAKRNVKAAIERVAARLGNTPTICRKCYVHPEVVQSYLDGQVLSEVKDEIDAELREDLAYLEPEEAALLVLLRKRLGSELEKAGSRAR
ncbi:MAG: topoisomerase [Hyphomicrobiales bacterium]|nr:topoisomerase [Hyphomicrobiales bacterium]